MNYKHKYRKHHKHPHPHLIHLHWPIINELHDQFHVTVMAILENNVRFSLHAGVQQELLKVFAAGGQHGAMRRKCLTIFTHNGYITKLFQLNEIGEWRLQQAWMLIVTKRLFISTGIHFAIGFDAVTYSANKQFRKSDTSFGFGEMQIAVICRYFFFLRAVDLAFVNNRLRNTGYDSCQMRFVVNFCCCKFKSITI